MLLAQLSDMHFRSQGMKLYDFIDTNAENARIINLLNQLEEKPDAVIITGDLANCGTAAEYQVAKRLLGYLNYPVYLIPGNHDNKSNFLNSFQPLCPSLGHDPEHIAYAIDNKNFPVRLLFIDSSLAGESKGYLTPYSIDWLTQQLSQQSKETFIFLHHPPLLLGNKQMDRIACENGHLLLALIKRFPHITRIFCGHVHRTIFTQYRQAIIASAPGTVHQIPYQFYDATDTYTLEPASMLMHRYVPETGIVSYSYALVEQPRYYYAHKISYAEE